MAARGHSKTNVWAKLLGDGGGGAIFIIILVRDSMEVHFVLEIQKQEKPINLNVLCLVTVHYRK